MFTADIEIKPQPLEFKYPVMNPTRANSLARLLLIKLGEDLRGLTNGHKIFSHRIYPAMVILDNARENNIKHCVRQEMELNEKQDILSNVLVE
jgi:hypothetical protein